MNTLTGTSNDTKADTKVKYIWYIGYIKEIKTDGYIIDRLHHEPKD